MDASVLDMFFRKGACSPLTRDIWEELDCLVGSVADDEELDEGTSD